MFNASEKDLVKGKGIGKGKARFDFRYIKRREGVVQIQLNFFRR